MSLREAAQQALDVMEDTRWAVADQAPNEDVAAHDKAMNTLRAALAEDAMQHLTDVQQEMEVTSQESRQVEPVAWLIEAYDIYEKCTLQRFVFDKPKNMQGVKITAYYTAPLKREPLTDEQIEFRFGKKPTKYMMFLIRSTERAHGIGSQE